MPIPKAVFFALAGFGSNLGRLAGRVSIGANGQTLCAVVAGPWHGSDGVICLATLFLTSSKSLLTQSRLIR
jgi:hypothetical protein